MSGHALRILEAAANGEVQSFPTEEETADYIGHLDKIIRTLQGHRRAIMSEVPGPLTGTDYRITEGRYADRSYNTAAILHRFGEAGWGITDLIRTGAVRLDWQWTKLGRAAQDARVDMLITQRELEDTGEVDGAMIGETWRSRLAVEAVTPGEHDG